MKDEVSCYFEGFDLKIGCSALKKWMESMTNLLGDDKRGFERFAYLCSLEAFSQDGVVFELISSIARHSYASHMPSSKRNPAAYEHVLLDYNETPHFYQPDDNDS
jgi:hypothetical protein